MHEYLFSIFPNEKFIDLGLYQYGWERCAPAHQFGPAARTHYLFHYVISGTGLLMAQDKKGETRNYSIKSGQGFLLYPGQISTYIADQINPWEYTWLEFDGLRVKEALDIAGFYHLGRGGGTGECIQKKVGMTDQVKWRFVWVIGNIEHFVHHDFPVFL